MTSVYDPEPNTEVSNLQDELAEQRRMRSDVARSRRERRQAKADVLDRMLPVPEPFLSWIDRRMASRSAADTRAEAKVETIVSDESVNVEVNDGGRIKIIDPEDRFKPWEEKPREPTGDRGDRCPCGYQNGKAMERHLLEDHLPQDFGLSDIEKTVIYTP